MDLFSIYLFNGTGNIGLAGAIIALISAVIGALIVVISDNWIEGNRRKQDKEKDRKRAYSRLKGFEYSILQTCKLCSIIHIDYLYFEYVNIIHLPDTADEKISYVEQHSVFFGRADEARYRQNELALELGKSREVLEKYLTDIELLFSDSPEIKSLKSSIDRSMQNLYNYWGQINKNYAAIPNQETSIKKKRDRLWHLKQDYMSIHSRKIDDLKKSIDDLLNYLKTELDDEES